MAKLESSEDFIVLMQGGKYANKVNAQRAAGRTRLSKAEKDKINKAIEAHFGSDDGTPAAKPSKKVVKKAAKKAAKKVAAKAAAPASEVTPESAPVAAPTGKPSKRLAKKAASKRGKTGKPAQAKAPPGTLPISPKEVNSVADVLQLVDNTVQRSVSIANALKQADEISKSGDISKGIERIKLTLEGAANLLHQQVVTPLVNSTSSVDPEVAQRLEQVVAATHPNAVTEQQLAPVPQHSAETLLS